jgi:hypothetical protein
MKRTGALGLLVIVLVWASCNVKRSADAKFGDQHFKTAIALVELYRIRHGSYPEKMSDIDFTGDWDRLALMSVAYRRLGDGYALDVTRGWVGKPKLAYPPEFWKGLGLKESNAKP